MSNGELLGICGITTKTSTEESSFPDEGTTIGEEQASAEACVAELQTQGINKIVLLTHVGYDTDLNGFAAIDGVDVIIGGHSHSLLGDAQALSPVGLVPSAEYAAIVSGTCVVQAWEYHKLVPKLDVAFDADGNVLSCNGEVYFPINPSRFTVRDRPDEERFDLNEADALVMRNYLLELGIFTDPGEEAEVVAALQPFRDSLEEVASRKVAIAAENICHTRADGSDPNCPGKEDRSRVGGGVCLIVAQGFLFNVPTADIAIQNAGGCRGTIFEGDFTFGNAFEILPFSNTLVTLEMTGDQIRRVLEDSVNFFLDPTIGGGGGSFPVSAGLRWHVDYTAEFGSRFSNIEVNRRLEEEWEPLDLQAVYNVVTNNFIATPRDGYLTFEEIDQTSDAYVDTFVLYTQSLIDYASDLGTLEEPEIDEYSTQVLTLVNGTTIDIREAQPIVPTAAPGGSSSSSVTSATVLYVLVGLAVLAAI